MNDDESKWLVRAMEGDDLAFTRIVETYQRPVFNLCYRMLGNAGDAEDAAQESFLRAYKSLNKYDPDRSFATWLLSIASHHCIDQIRKRKFSTFSIDNDDYAWFEPKDQDPGPEKKLGNKEKQVQVHKLLNTLNPLDKAAIVLLYWYDYSYEEIAETLSLSVSAVKSRLHRARKTLALSWQSNENQEISSERIRNESPAF